MTVARIAVSAANFAIDRPYDYKVPDSLSGLILPGMRVAVPFGRGNRHSEGVVLSLSDGSGFEKLKSVEAALDKRPVLEEEQLKLALWMSDRFFCTVYDAIRAMLPAGMWFKGGAPKLRDKTVKTALLAIPSEEVRLLAEQLRLKSPQQAAVLELLCRTGEMPVKELQYYTGASAGVIKALERRGAVTAEAREVFRRPAVRQLEKPGPLVLSGEQETVFFRLRDILSKGEASAALLCGVTGSGKTPVYIKLIEETLARGKSAIVLVPEIALTPQLMSIFASYFGDNVAVLHSALSAGERYDEWKRIRTGLVRVAVGTRSAVFAPVRDLGLVILDEEQEHTYKSENSPRYHARDVAKYRCARAGAMLLLGSATPSVESMYLARAGKYTLLRLENRYNEQPLPRVVLADMKEELKNGNGGNLGAVLERELRENLARGEQSILFINRRGANTLIACGSCGYTYSCPRCSVSMTYHSVSARLLCHYCGYSQPRPEECPECGGKLKYVGAGTQKLEAELKELLPEAGVVRMDADTVSFSGSHEKLLSEFREKRVPILLGTQMVTKGLDFENVTLVGVISADLSLYVNDYRAHERTFSLITQVIGRSGRGAKEGRAVIQTLTPENEVITLASRQDYDSFYEREIAFRALGGVPPVRDLLTVTASGLDEAAVLAGCVRLRNTLEGYLRDLPDVKILGPAPAAVSKINNRYRYRISLLCENSRRVRETIAHSAREFARDGKNRGVSVYADTDPHE